MTPRLAHFCLFVGLSYWAVLVVIAADVWERLSDFWLRFSAGTAMMFALIIILVLILYVHFLVLRDDH